MNTIKKQIEDIFDQALELRAQGVNTHEILERFPDHATELRELFESVEMLEKTSQTINPDTTLLPRIMDRVTKADRPRFTFRERIKTRIINFKEIMAHTTKVILPIIALAAITLIVAKVSTHPPQDGTPGTASHKPQDTATPDVATNTTTPSSGDDVEDIFAQLASEEASEQSIASEGDADSDVITSDTTIINQLSHDTYENEL